MCLIECGTVAYKNVLTGSVSNERNIVCCQLLLILFERDVIRYLSFMPRIIS